MKRAVVVGVAPVVVFIGVSVLFSTLPSTVPTTVEAAPQRVERDGRGEWFQTLDDACDDTAICVWVLWSQTRWEERQQLIGSTWQERQAARPRLTWEDWRMHGPLDKLRPREVLPEPTRDGLHAGRYLHVFHTA